MARKPQKIVCRSWVHKGGELVEVDALSPEDRREVATQLSLGLLNSLYAGKAEFRRAEDVPDDGRVWTPVEPLRRKDEGEPNGNESRALP